MRSKIVKVFGDLYYKEISIEDTIKVCLEFLPPNTIKNKADIESFAGLQLSKAFPLDRPQWQVWIQMNYEGEKALIVYKSHHSLCDGISGMGINMQCDEKFDPDKMIATGRIRFYQRVLFRIIAPLLMPVLFMEGLSIQVLKNPLHDGKRDLTGVKKCALSEQMTFADIKLASKLLKITINDLITSSLSVAVSRYFREKDPGTNHTRLNLVLPANIRWSRYETFDEVKCENKFAPYPLTIPLSENA